LEIKEKGKELNKKSKGIKEEMIEKITEEVKNQILNMSIDDLLSLEMTADDWEILSNHELLEDKIRREVKKACSFCS